MRFLLMALILILPSSSVFAFTVSETLKDCKVWRDSGFEYSQPMNKEGTPAIACMSYMWALSETGHVNCINDEAAHLSFYATPDKLAQAFINFAEAHPEIWDGPVVQHLPFFTRRFPCPE